MLRHNGRVSYQALHDLCRNPAQFTLDAPHTAEDDAEVREKKRTWVGEQLQVLERRGLVQRLPDRKGRRPEVMVLSDRGDGNPTTILEVQRVPNRATSHSLERSSRHPSSASGVRLRSSHTYVRACVRACNDGGSIRSVRTPQSHRRDDAVRFRIMVPPSGLVQQHEPQLF